MQILTQSPSLQLPLQPECVLSGECASVFSFLLPNSLPTLHFELLAGEFLMAGSEFFS